MANNPEVTWCVTQHGHTPVWPQTPPAGLNKAGVKAQGCHQPAFSSVSSHNIKNKPLSKESLVSVGFKPLLCTYLTHTERKASAWDAGKNHECCRSHRRARGGVRLLIQTLLL